MKRRTLLVGLGSAAAGSAVVFGSGAFTQVSADRGVTIGIDRDSGALLALIANDDIDTVFESDDGELEIDTEKLSEDNEGFNVGATVQLGEIEDNDDREVPEDGEAFLIRNNFDQNIDATIDLTDEDLEVGDTDLTLVVTRSDNDDGEELETSNAYQFEGLEAGEEIRVSLEIETESTSDPDDIEGEVTFSAEPSPLGSAPNPTTTVTNERTGEEYDDFDQALGDAEDGDTLVMGPSNSNYSISSIETDNLTIKGPNAGVPGDANRGTEAIIGDSFSIEADGVTIDGVRVENPDDGSRGMRIEEGEEVTLKNSVVTGGRNHVQMQFAGDTPANVTIEANRFVELDDEDGTAVAGTEDVEGLEIVDNVFEDNRGAVGIGEGASDVTITGNEFSGGEFYLTNREESLNLVETVLENNDFDRAVGVHETDDDTQSGFDGLLQWIPVDIQSGVDTAAPESTVEVASGTYEEQVVIDRSLTLEGSEDTTLVGPEDRDSFTIPESDDDREPVLFAYGGDETGGDISGSEVVEVDVSGFTIDGNDVNPGEVATGILFRNVEGAIVDNEIQNMHEGGSQTFGIIVYGDSDVDVLDNEVTEYERGGIGIQGSEGSPAPEAIVENNTVSGPGEPVGGWGANGIQFGLGSTGEARNNTVTGHLHEDAEPGGILAFASENVLIEDNTLENNRDGVQVYGDTFFETGLDAVDTTVQNNVFEGNIAAVAVGSKSTDTTVTENEIQDNDIGLEIFGGEDNMENLGFNQNNIVGNGDGVENLDDYVVDATENWWGDEDGPSGEGPGNGDSVDENVDFDPWLDAPFDEGGEPVN